MPYYPPQPNQPPEPPARKGKVVRRIVLFASAALMLYGGIRLGIYLSEMMASRQTDAKVAAILADIPPAEEPAGAPETEAPAPAAERTAEKAAEPETEPASVPAEASPATETKEISETLPIIQYPNGYKGNEKIFRLQKESPYIIGLLQMDDMEQAEAVVKKDNTFYLNHDALGNRNSNGAIFMDQDISLETRPYTILLYGHNMKSGEKFGKLRKYEDFSYYYQHRIFRLTLTYDEADYVIFSVAKVSLTPGSRNYVSMAGLQSANRKTRRKALDSLIGCSVHRNTLDVNEEDQLVLLITCVGDDNDRLIVAGRRLREGEPANNLNMK